MPEKLLQTRLYYPTLRPNLVPRPQLADRLNQAIAQGCKLTRVSAPTGSGRSTLVTSWLPEKEDAATRLSLDQGDNNLVRYWSYVIAAIQVVKQELGLGAAAIGGAFGLLFRETR